ncbi:beta-sarcoglycan [Prorops nasuta]|uniref:beta-sarcoglycan n=1 Tax=Prorops nasuta TaxID=863751 RepID=UPI0034CFA2B5
MNCAIAECERVHMEHRFIDAQAPNFGPFHSFPSSNIHLLLENFQSRVFPVFEEFLIVSRLIRQNSRLFSSEFEIILPMSAFIDTAGNETGSPSISKADDNLSNSEGPLIKKSLCGNNTGRKRLSSENVNGQFSSKQQINERSTRKRYCLWTLTLILGLIGLCNLFLSLTVIAILRIGQGMESLEVIPDESLIKLYGRSDLDNVCVQSGICQGYGDEPMELSGDEAGIQIEVKKYSSRNLHHANVLIQKNGTSVSRVKTFDVKDPKTGSTYFSTDFPNFGLPDGVERIDVKIAETHRITSPMNASLTIKSDKEISMQGAEGARMDGKEVVWSANSDVFLKSINGSIILDAKNGISIDINKIPIAPLFLSKSTAIETYKVCVCMPEGKLFKVPVTSENNYSANCANWMSENDPCLR